MDLVAVAVDVDSDAIEFLARPLYRRKEHGVYHIRVNLRFIFLRVLCASVVKFRFSLTR
jgi:hypothetical protein